MFESNKINEKNIMQLNVTLYLKGEEIETTATDDIFYGCVSTDLLGNVLNDDDEDVCTFEERRGYRIFIINKNILVFSLEGFVGDHNFYDYACGLQIEYDNIGLAEILFADEPDGLYYLAKDVVPLFKDHIKDMKNKNQKTFNMNLPTVWSYSSWLTEDYFSGGFEGDSEWDYLGVLDMNNVPILNISNAVKGKIDFLDDIWRFKK